MATSNSIRADVVELLEIERAHTWQLWTMLNELRPFGELRTAEPGASAGMKT